MRFTVSALALLTASPAFAEVPQVVTDIAPVHGLVARVMEGVGSPTLLVEPGASPHGYALRPSQAASLEAADAVVLIGHELTPWLADPLETLAENAVHLELLEAPGTELFDFRETAVFERDEHDHDAHSDDEHDHEDHGEEEHGHDEHDHDDHGEEEHDHDEHDHGEEEHDAHGHDHDHDHDGTDPHAWLSPDNAVAWLPVIAETLAELDPANAETYHANAAAGAAEITSAAEAAREALAPHRDTRFIAFHDAFQYFETSMGLSASGALMIGDATPPSAGRMAELQELVSAEGIDCIFSEPQYNPNLVSALSDGTGLSVVVIDPLGLDITQGPGFYPELITAITGSVLDCVGQE